MRIIAGEWKGRQIRVPRDSRVRPTADRAREAWLSIVAPHVVSARVVDLFAGSGALGFEALSRGASHCLFVDISAASLAAIRTNAVTLGAEGRIELRHADALRFVRKAQPGEYDIAFADPPWNLGLAAQLAQIWLETPFANLLGVEHDIHEIVPGSTSTRRYGATAISIFSDGDDPAAANEAGDHD
ncbi:MAG: 16S rRNA (guanine(966)-N(2))-methyltransferase RsmD [Gemmatimonadota bacterium]